MRYTFLKQEHTTVVPIDEKLEKTLIIYIEVNDSQQS